MCIRDRDSRVLSIVLTTIKTEEKFEALWDRIKIFGGVLQTEHQLLTNREVYSVLTFIVRPKSKLEMDKWLGQSVWDATSYQVQEQQVVHPDVCGLLPTGVDPLQGTL